MYFCIYMCACRITKMMFSFFRKLDVDLIRWVITVPAIWNDKAKSFMREAAFKVNMCVVGTMLIRLVTI